MNLTDGREAQMGLAMPPHAYMEEKLIALQRRAEASLSNKLTKVAELYELDVLSAEDAIKAATTAIRQHEKVQGQIECE